MCHCRLRHRSEQRLSDAGWRHQIWSAAAVHCRLHCLVTLLLLLLHRLLLRLLPRFLLPLPQPLELIWLLHSPPLPLLLLLLPAGGLQEPFPAPVRHMAILNGEEQLQVICTTLCCSAMPHTQIHKFWPSARWVTATMTPACYTQLAMQGCTQACSTTIGLVCAADWWL